jgi:VanZ family protein
LSRVADKVAESRTGMRVAGKVGAGVLVGGFVVAFAAPLPIELDPSIAGHVSALFHVVAYALLTAGAVCRYPSRACVAVSGVLLFGVVLETAQLFVPGRYFGFVDMLANASGVAAGIGFAMATRWRAGAFRATAPIEPAAVG